MTIILGFALGLILAGLVMVWLSPGVKQSLLAQIVYWAGILLIIVGLVLLLTPVLIWVNLQLRSMLGQG